MGSLLLIFALYVFGPVDVSVFPPVAHAPASFRVRGMIEKHADNRRLTLEIDGPEYKRSDFQIAGAQSQRVFEWHRLELRTVGEYIATATLVRITDGREKKLVSTSVFRVSGFDPYAPE